MFSSALVPYRLDSYATACSVIDVETVTPPASVLVTGASGTVGAFLVAVLGERGVGVHAMTRRFTDADAVVSSGVERVVGDLTDPASLSRALRGVATLYLLVPAAPLADQIAMFRNALRAAEESGVSHVVVAQRWLGVVQILCRRGDRSESANRVNDAELNESDHS